MDDLPRARLVLVRGGKPEGGQAPGEATRAPPPLRVIPGGPASDIQAAIADAIAAARQVRQEIQARIARELEEPPT